MEGLPAHTIKSNEGERDWDDDDVLRLAEYLDLPNPLGDVGPGTSASPDQPASEAQLLFEQNLHDAVRTLKPLKPVPAPAL